MTKPVPKDKIVVCVEATRPLYVWFNSDAALHGHGQLPCGPADHPALTRTCFLDLARVTTFPPNEVAAALERDLLSDAMKARICAMVRSGIDVLPERHAEAILRGLDPPLRSAPDPDQAI